MKEDSVSVKAGDIVEKGQTIGTMGSTGPHLHFEIRTVSGYANNTDPTSYVFGN